MDKIILNLNLQKITQKLIVTIQGIRQSICNLIAHYGS